MAARTVLTRSPPRELVLGCGTTEEVIMQRVSFPELARRVWIAPSAAAGLRELLVQTPPDTLARVGLSHRRSTGSTLALTAAVFSVGAVVGAASVLVTAMLVSDETRAKLRQRARRIVTGMRRRVEDLEHAAVSLEAAPTSKANGPVA